MLLLQQYKHSGVDDGASASKIISEIEVDDLDLRMRLWKKKKACADCHDNRASYRHPGVYCGLTAELSLFRNLPTKIPRH